MMLEQRFVSPHEIAGESGLWLFDFEIAQSLGITLSHFREKIRGRGFLDRIEAQGFRVIANAIACDPGSLALDLMAAKFFVGKHNSEAGDGYLAYLLRLEEGVTKYQEEIAADPLATQIQQNLEIRLAQLRTEKRLESLQKDHLALSERVDLMNGDTGYRTVLAAAREHGITVPLRIAKELGRMASRYCRENNIKIGKVPDERWGEVRSYPKKVLDVCFEQRRLL